MSYIINEQTLPIVCKARDTRENGGHQAFRWALGSLIGREGGSAETARGWCWCVAAQSENSAEALTVVISELGMYQVGWSLFFFFFGFVFHK